jgi:hypothetical protein
MSKRGILILAIVGLALAILSSALFPLTLSVVSVNFGATLGSLLGGMIAAAIAARVLIGRGSSRRVPRLAIPLLSAVAFAFFSSAAASLAISLHILDIFALSGAAQEKLGSSFVIAVIIGAVAYLVAATLYGFVGTAQGVNVGTRTGLLVILLLSVIPILNVLGLIVFLVAAIVRTPKIAATTVPEVEASPTETPTS